MVINGYTFHKLQQWQVDYLKEHYQDKLTDLENKLNICDETLYRLLKALDIKRKRLWFRILPDTEEVKKDLANPYLSHVKIAKKYYTTPDVVAQRRKRLGFQVRKCVGRTLLEEKIASILDEFDIAYIEQKRIGKWSIDFYLGNKTALDVHGTWVHNKPIVQERDSNKVKELQSLGYDYIVIKEDELQNAKEIISERLEGKFKCQNKQPV